MSADDYAICPKCKGISQVEKCPINLDEFYGKMSKEEYQKKLVEKNLWDETHQIKEEETLKEYYELGIAECGGGFMFIILVLVVNVDFNLNFIIQKKLNFNGEYFIRYEMCYL